MPPAIVRLPFDDSLTRAGVAYAKLSLHYTFNRMGLNHAARLRKIVAGVAVELAFQRWLDAQGLAYDRLGATAFTDKDRYDLRLGGRLCDLKSYLIADKAKIRAVRRDPNILHQAEALVPEDQFRASRLEPHDFYVFGFLAGLETRSLDDQRAAQANGQPLYLLATLAKEQWLGRAAWRSLGRIFLKAETTLTVEVGGQDADRAAQHETLTLAPQVWTPTAQPFHAVLYLHTPAPPVTALAVHSEGLGETLILTPFDWVNIWVYGLEVFLAGWLTRREFETHSRLLPAQSAVWQYARTRTLNRAAPVSDLWPLADLADLLRARGHTRPSPPALPQTLDGLPGG